MLARNGMNVSRQAASSSSVHQQGYATTQYVSY
jgi:hypothetical protein